jgi:hypothetical protein
MTNIQWITAYEEGLQVAKEQKKPMLLDFFKNG